MGVAQGREWVGPKEAGELLGVSTETVIRWSNDGHIHGVIRSVGGHRRIPVTEIERLIADGRAAEQAGKAGTS